jgi:hypothetical protein
MISTIVGLSLVTSSPLASDTAITLHYISLRGSHVHITHSEWEGNVWVYRLPEYIVLFSDDGEVRVNGVDRNDNDGSIKLTGVRPFPHAAKYTFILRPSEDVVDIEATIENTADREWNAGAFCVLCMQFNLAPDFVDTNMTRTTFRSGGKFLAIRETGNSDRHAGHLVQSKDLSMFSNDVVSRYFQNGEPADCSLIVRSSEDDRRHVALAWENGLSVSYNLNQSLNCTHSNPGLGALKPGESKTLRGRIYFLTGTRGELYRRFLKDFPEQGHGAESRDSLERLGETEP